MTHMHVAGSIHADATSPAPLWLTRPDDVNALTAAVWSKNAFRNADGEVEIAGRTAASIVAEMGSPVYVIDEDDFRTRARQWRDAFAGCAPRWPAGSPRRAWGSTSARAANWPSPCAEA